MLNETWSDQYRRMQRSRERLLSDLNGSDSAVARDSLYRFYQDVFHLLDWICADPSTAHLKSEVRQMSDDSPALRVCADVANGTKHLHLDRTSRVTGKRQGHAEVVSQNATAHVPRINAVGSAFPGSVVPNAKAEVGSVHHSWFVRVNGTDRDAVELAEQAVADWDTWLDSKGLAL
ncbi:hypothetical protein EEB12_21030 [Rhodococcus sp. WS1]|uniref:hypothetical protein n=1 Tax=unclassified Rhodococcus (in: high G+C Gram-positive bacteria) TaxID=192944 RepID=UPI0011444375|nr:MULTISPECIES: hypothetical protein [unclassified Rhodococcus (in: high G+C Gram-positive bacteria)]ROZ56201.1 hypothetical protein EEB12_21030 [Rhodococcus sp. WS1]TQC40394.1 hypothetical protein EEB16_01270 [Rhodococcus sp. WS7]